MTKYEWEKELKKNIYRLPPDEIDKIVDYYDELFLDKAESGMRERDIISEFGNPFDVARKIMNEYETENGKNYDKNDYGQNRENRGEYEESVNANEQDDFDDRPEFIKKFAVNVKNAILRAKDEFFYGKYNGPDANKTKNRDEREYAGSEKFNDTIYHYEGSKKSGRNNEKYEYESERSKPDERSKSESKNINDKSEKKSGGCLTVFFKVLFFIPFIIIIISLWATGISLIAGGVATIIAGIGQTAIGFMSITVSGPAALAKIGFGVASAGIGVLLFLFAIWFIKLIAKMTALYFSGRRKERAERGEII